MGSLMAGCERDRLSPVEIKVDEDAGYTAIGNVALEAVHIVSGGETLFDVANKYNVDPINLAKINGIRPPYNTRNGQALKLPTENFPIQEEFSEEVNVSQEKEREKAVKKLEKEMDDEFAGVMSVSAKNTNTAATSQKTTFNDQERTLSTPKITQTAVGTTPPAKKVNEAPVTPPKPPVSTSGKMTYPVKGKVISGFGDVRDGISNDGINIKASLGTPIKASANGEVIYTGNKLEEFGNTVIIKHDNNIITSYAHLNDVKVKSGAVVHQGDVIGTVGKTGDVSEPQLHFEVLKNKMPVNPSKYLD
jgi:murein DD-endopeptidase MepM/ murein hydrolase activator NlpD